MSRLNSSSASSSSVRLLRRLVVVLLRGGLQRLLRRLVSLQEPVHDRLERRDQFALLGLRVQLHRHHAIHLEIVVVAGGVQLGAQVVDEVRVGDVRQFGRRVVGLERRSARPRRSFTKSST